MRQSMPAEEAATTEFRTVFYAPDRKYAPSIFSTLSSFMCLTCSYSWKTIISRALVRPFRLFITEPIVQLLGLYMAFVYGVLYCAWTPLRSTCMVLTIYIHGQCLSRRFPASMGAFITKDLELPVFTILHSGLGSLAWGNSIRACWTVYMCILGPRTVVRGSPSTVYVSTFAPR
jgi:hypothetical protein